MPNPAIADYINVFPELGKCAEAPEIWQEENWYRSVVDIYDLTEKIQRGKKFQERMAFGESWKSLAEIESECNVPNWDGYGAAPISLDAVGEVRLFLRLVPANLVAPAIVPEPSGAVGLEWRRGKEIVLVLSFNGKGVITYASRFGAEVSRYGVERFIETIPLFIQRELLSYFVEES